MEFSERYNNERIIICVDFKKAFDTVGRDILFRTLSAFGFGPSTSPFVDNEEIKLSLYADDLTGFLKNDHSLANFLRLIEDYGTCSGLKINHEKAEIMLLGNRAYILQEDNAALDNMKIKKIRKNLESTLYL